MNNYIYPICLLLLVFVAFFSSLGQFLFKLAAKKQKSVIRTFFSFEFICGGLCFFFSILLTFVAAKHVDYAVIFAMTALNYIFIFALTGFFLKETLDSKKLIGLVFIVIGLFVMIL